MGLGSVFAASYPPPFYTTELLNSQNALGLNGQIQTGSYLRLVNFNQNYGSWFHEVFLVDQNNRAQSSRPVRVSQNYLYKQMGNTINRNLEFIDRATGKTVTGYSGQRYIITGAQNKGWKTYDIHFISEGGVGVDHKGITNSAPRSYKITQRYLDSDRLRTPVNKINRLNSVVKSAGSSPSGGCLNKTAAPVRKAIKGDSFTYLVSNRSSLRGMGNRACMKEKKLIQNLYLDKHPYGKLSISGRANKILSDAKSVLNTMKAASGSKNKAVRSRYKNFTNGHYIDPVVTPEVSACIVFQETKGNLNPYAVNYTLCNKKMLSTAHGLTQVTRTTMEGLVDNVDGDLMPLNTSNSKKYKGMSTREIHAKMSGDVGMQLEVMMRILSSNAKHIRWRNKGLLESEVLRRAIIQYDRDNQSKYIRNVLKKCLPCFKNGGSGSKCYKTVK